jgi:hypothetical protein
MSVRLFHRGARLVFVVRRIGAGDERWWSPHLRVPDWRAVLEAQLALLGLSPHTDAEPGVVRCGSGEITWIDRRAWSTIEVRLHRGSEQKRRLVAMALLKAARYARQPRDTQGGAHAGRQ